MKEFTVRRTVEYVVKIEDDEYLTDGELAEDTAEEITLAFESENKTFKLDYPGVKVEYVDTAVEVSE